MGSSAGFRAVRGGPLAVLLVALAAFVGVLAGTSTASADQTDRAAPAVLVGVGGLRWSDVSADRTPALYRLADRAALGALSVRTVDEPTCPLDGWLTLSAGARASGPHPCQEIPEPIGERVREWTGLADLQQDTDYRSELGVLGDRLAAADTCATAVGPGAAVTLANSRGEIARYAERFAPDVLADCPLTVVDAGTLPTTESRRTKALQDFDQLLGEIVDAAGPDGTILVAGLADEAVADRTALRLGLAASEDHTGQSYDGHWLGSASTRQDGLAQLTDLAPTLAELAGADGLPDTIGGAWRPAGERPDELPDAIGYLLSFDTVQRVVGQQSVWLYAGLAGGQLLAYGLALCLRRRWSHWSRRTAVTVAAVAAAVPAGTFLTELLPWARAEHPTWWLWSGLFGLTGLIVVLASMTNTATRSRAIWAMPTALAAVTALVLGVDVATGSHLQSGNLLTPGDLPVVGGRFFGLGNVGFAIFGTSALILAGGVAAYARERGHSRGGWLAALGIGAVAVFVDGWPGWGADFGGVLALMPAVVVLVAGVAGVRLTVRRLLLTGVAAVVAVGLVAVVDWLRPTDRRSHLGGFVQQVLDGEALPVIVRKAEMSLGTVFGAGGMGWIAIVAYVVTALLVLAPNRFRASGLVRAYEQWPTLLPTLRAVLTVGAVGFAVNDSGLVVPAVVLLTGVPLAVLAVARANAQQ